MKNYLFPLLLLIAACKKPSDLQQKTVSANQQIPFCDMREMPGKKIMAASFGSSKVLFLDFDGHTVDNTAWNYNGPIVCAASGLTAQQQADILNQTAQDYAAFDVIVTADSSLYAAADPNRRSRCIYTTTWQWYGMAGGVAFVGSFMWGDDTPCFVFTSLLNYVTKTIQDAGSHELGHTIGLYHQASYNNNCGMTTPYNSGQGTGETGWAPIMGLPYSRNLNTFFDGPNSFGCTNYQDDISIISFYIPLKTDDFPNDFTASQLLYPDDIRNGIIESKNDADVFQLAAFGNKKITVELQSFNNIDGRIEVYDAAQQLLLTIDPITSIHVFATQLPQSARYLKVLASPASPNIKRDVQLGRYQLKITKVLNR